MIWTRSLLIWSQTRYRCATESDSLRKRDAEFHSISMSRTVWFIMKITGYCSQTCSRGRVVKASDSKSDSLWERRFESCRLRTFFICNQHRATSSLKKQESRLKNGLGDMGDRTPGLLNANQTLYHWAISPGWAVTIQKFNIAWE